jgi:endogenous inhibitor of DNA gyrase (YacG/DUF329 family)
VSYLKCPECSLTIPEPPTLFAPRSCARCRLVKGRQVALERVKGPVEDDQPEAASEADQAAAT